jgi:hypothetical protein
MRITIGVLLILVAAECAAQQLETFSRPPLAQLPGSWRSAAGAEVTDEFWSAAEGGLMLGGGRTVRDGRAVWFEHLRIEQVGDSIFYVSHPSGQKPAAFLLVASDSASLTFTNPLHDFPQRITYRFPGPDSLAVTLEGRGRTGQRSSVFSFSRRPSP